MPLLPDVDPTMTSIIRDQLGLTTWILLGACVQSLLVLSLPTKVAFLPATLLLSARIIKVVLMAAGLIHDTTQDKVLKGRRTAQPPDALSVEEKEAAKDVTVFIIAARSNHPLSLFAPGFLTAKEYFDSMWLEAETDTEKSGYLGRSSDMLASDDSTGNAIVTLSYWKSMAHLDRFARGPAHQAGFNWFNKTVKTHPHLSVMHEVYSMPRGHWENTYTNFTPFGMGQTKMRVKHTGESKEEKEELVSPLMLATGPKWRNMRSRMPWLTTEQK